MWGVKLCNAGFDDICQKVIEKKPVVIACCTLNEIVMANDDKEFMKKINYCDMIVPDGMPLVWYLKRNAGKGERVYGPELMKKILITNYELRINNQDLPLTPSLKKEGENFFLKNEFGANFKHLFVGHEKNRKFFLKFGDYVVMPMKERFDKNDMNDLEKVIKRSGANVVWLGLGAKKQVEVAYELKKRKINKTVITVGAAFDFLSGNKIQAPKWIRNNGGEWLFRLISEPKRLGKRYGKIFWFLVKLKFGNGFLKNSGFGKR